MDGGRSVKSVKSVMLHVLNSALRARPRILRKNAHFNCIHPIRRIYFHGLLRDFMDFLGSGRCRYSPGHLACVGAKSHSQVEGLHSTNLFFTAAI